MREDVVCIKFEGHLFKKGKYWPIFVPALDLHTQGKSKRDAMAMLKEVAELSVDREGFSVSVTLLDDDRVVLRTKRGDDDKHLVALMLKNQRAKYGLTIQEVANRLGVSKHAYAQYEQARAIPSITKIVEFINAMNNEAHITIDLMIEKKAA